MSFLEHPDTDSTQLKTELAHLKGENARLRKINAQMLAALEDSLKVLEGGVPASVDFDAIKEAVAKVQDAIAEAVRDPWRPGFRKDRRSSPIAMKAGPRDFAAKVALMRASSGWNDCAGLAPAASLHFDSPGQNAAAHNDDAVQLASLFGGGHRSDFSAMVEASARRQARWELTILPADEMGPCGAKKKLIAVNPNHTRLGLSRSSSGTAKWTLGYQRYMPTWPW
jgi:hypothetical protein